MDKSLKFFALILIFYFGAIFKVSGQTIPKVKLLKTDQLVKPVKEKIASTRAGVIASEWTENTPITTSFDDALFEIPLLTDFELQTSDFQQLASLSRFKDGRYLLPPGAYTMMAKSFCLKAGTYGPSTGDGHLLAPLKGKRADFVNQILYRYGQNPTVNQHDVQLLLWAIVAGADMNTLADQHLRTIYQLFTVEDFAKYKSKHLAEKYVNKYVNDLKKQINQGINSYLAPALEAEEKIQYLAQKANATYEDFERIALLEGAAPASDMIRSVSRGRWSYHPDGYFVRYFPFGYQRTQIDLIVPSLTEVEMDDKNRIHSITDQEYGKIILNYSSDIYASEEKDGFYSYITKLLSIEVNGINMPLNDAIEIYFISPTQLEVSGSINKSGQLVKFLTEIENLQTIGSGSNGRAPADVSTVVFLPQLIALISYGYTLYEIKQCCRENNPNLCILKVLAQRALFAGLKKYLTTKKISSPFAVSHLSSEINVPAGSVLFSPTSTVATPANRSSQRIGIAPLPVTPAEEDFTWLKTIPNCPCKYEDASGVTYTPPGRWVQCNDASQQYHYGAVYEVRWVPEKSDMPGQQCTYDKYKQLIGYGIAAGSADRYSPGICGDWSDMILLIFCQTNVSKHYQNDVKNWNEISCDEYRRIRPSNNVNCLNKNPVNDWHYGQMCVFVSGMTCPDIVEVFKRFRDAPDVPVVMKNFMERGQIESSDDISGIITFINKCASEQAFNNEQQWHQSFILRVRDYLDAYQTKGNNPAACQYKEPLYPPEWKNN